MRPLLVIAIKLMLFSTSLAQNAKVTVNIRGLISSNGKVFVALFANKQGFPDNTANQAFYTNTITPIEKQASFSCTLQPGTYALSVFHDANSNQQLDKNWVGYPKEKFGFSNNPRVTISAPNFEECSFKVEKDMVVTIDLN